MTGTAGDGGGPDGGPAEFASGLAARLAGLLGPALAGVYLHGSAALGGWTAGRGDIDVLVLTGDDISPDAVAAAGSLLLAAARAGPGRGLECSVVTAGQAARPAPPWPFLLHVGQRLSGPVLVRGGSGDPAPPAGDPDLLMHYAVCRAAGIALAGPPAAAVIGPVARPAILEYLAGEMDWGLENATESYAVLNACRALVYLEQDKIVSKVAGGEAALGRGLGPGGLLRRALDQQRERAAERAPAPDAAAFVREVAAALRACTVRDAVVRNGGARPTGSPPA